MAQIEINKDEVLNAVAAFEKQLAVFESATSTFITATQSIQDMNSDFVNQMKDMADMTAKMAEKDVFKLADNYKNAVKKVAEEFGGADDDLAKQLNYMSGLNANNNRLEYTQNGLIYKSNGYRHIE